MNPRERFLNAVKGEPVDRVPLVLEKFHAPSRESVDDLPDPGVREIAHRIFGETHYGVDVPSYVNRYLVTPQHLWRTVDTTQNDGDTVTTVQLDTPKGTLTAISGQNPLTQTTWQVKYPVETMADIERIRSAPWERHPDLRPADLSDLPADFGDRGIVRSGVSCPAVCVGGMMSYQMFLELCATEFDLIRELTEICTERVLDTLDVVLANADVEYVWMGGCEWLTPPMGSPRLYDELIQPFEKRVIDRIHAAGALSHVHCHGRVRSTLEAAIERGADMFEPVEPPPDGDVTFAEAKAVVDGRMTLGGNMEARILDNEDERAAETVTRAAFEGTKERMVLQTSAGPIGSMTPQTVKNYHRVIDVWEELSAIAGSD